MKPLRIALAAALLASAAPVWSQDEDMGEIIVTAQRRQSEYFVEERPVVGLRRQADSAVQRIEIASDSRDEDVRKREVSAMLLAAIERAGSGDLSLVTGRFELVEVTKSNYRDLVFGKVSDEADDDDDEDDDDEDEDAAAGFEDDGDTTTIRLMVKARLAGSVGGAQQRIDGFIKGVPATGRSLIEKSGGLALTIVNPDQYRDEILRRVSTAAKHHAGFFGADYGVEVTGLDKDIAWAQVSNTDVFLYIPYHFTVRPK